MSEQSFWRKWNPAVPRRWLFVIAGLIWTGVGCLLCFRAINWYSLLPHALEIPLIIASVVIAFFGYILGFSKVARKNIKRISELPERVCVFAFTAWKGYFMIGTMITLGITLRSSSIPKEYLAIPYTVMGGVLLLGSLEFYAIFLAAQREIV